jgi:tetratricopeptide (TPR) repeat protein
LLSLASLYLAVRYWDTQKKTLAYFSGIALFLACLAKENGVVFLAIIPLTLYVRQKTNPKQNTSSLPLLLSLALSFIIYFIIRYSILGWSLGEAPLDLINNPFIKYTGEGWVHCSTPEKLAMIFWSLGKYLQLLVLPYALSTDYYPRFVEVITFSNPIALMSLVAYLSLGLFVLYKLLKKQTNLIIYGIGFFLIALSIVSNLFFPVGTHLAERFLFMPSVGFCIVLSGAFLPFFVGGKKAASLLISGLLGVVLLGFGIRTYVRNFDFKSNKVLFSKDIQVSAKSAKMQNAYGSIIAEEALNSQDQIEKDSLSKIALEHLNEAIIIHPTYLEAFYMRGNVYFMFGDYEKAISDYRQCLQLNANFKDAYGNYALAMRESARSLLASKGDLQKAIAYLEESVRLYPDEQETKNLLEQAKKMLVPNQ